MAEQRFFIQYDGDTVTLIPFWGNTEKQDRVTVTEWEDDELVERRSEANEFTTEELVGDENTDEVLWTEFDRIYEEIDTADRFGAHPPKPPRPPQG